nr:retrovirus-related Pol polyprotein from transposon TNT 1-94 [Tanacetum cinerariifolium]
MTTLEDPDLSFQQVFWIQQYLQHEHYALWEVIEFGDSYVVPTNDPNITTTTSGDAGTKSRRTVTFITEDMQRKKNDATILKTFGGNEATKKRKKNFLKQQYGNFKAEGSESLEQTFNRLQVIVGQLQFMDMEVEQDDLNQKFLTSLAPEWLMHTIDINQIDEDDIEEMDIKWSMALLNCKKNNDSLNCKITDLTDKLFDANNFIYHYKLALVQVESRLVKYKERKVKYIEKIKTLEFYHESNRECNEILSKKLETLKLEKDRVDGKLAGLLTASKDLDNLIESQRPSPTVESTSKDNQNRNSSASEDVASPITPKPFFKFLKPKYCQFKNDANILLRTPRQHNMYSIDLNIIVPHRDLTCLVAKASADECILWHRRLGHLNFKILNKLVRHNLVRGLPTKCFENNHTCTACLKGKQHKATCKPKLVNSVTKPLHTLHMDLFGPTFVSSISHKWYCLVMTDDFSRCDNGGKFRNKEMNDFCLQKGIKREFSNARTPQQNGVAERRNRTLIEAARSMDLVNKSHNKTPYELFNGRSPAIGFLEPFGCHVMILNTLDNLGKFEEKGDEGYFIGCSMSSKAFRVFNKRNRRVEENLHVEFLENKAIEKGTKDAARQEVKKDVSSLRYIALPNWAHDALLEFSSSQPQDHCSTEVPKGIRNSNPAVSTSNPPADQMETLIVETPIPTVSSLVPSSYSTDSQEPSIEPKKISDALQDPSWVEAMQEELLQFKIQNVWTLVDCTKGVRPIGTKWVLKNKKDERGIVIRNKARLLAQGHTQEERIDYDEVFAPVARIEAIRLFLPYASFMGFVVYQMDVKSAFLYGTIDEEVKQREDFLLVQVYVDDIILGSLNPQLCREFEALMHKKFQMSAMGELNFFLGLQVLQKEDGLFLSQDKYVGDIIKKFGYSNVRSSNTPMDKENPWGKEGTGKDVDLHLYRSMIRSLMYLTASRPDIMFTVCVCARHQVTPKECHLHAVKRIFRYLKGHPKLGLWYLKDSPFDLVSFSDSDYGGATQDRKSTTRGCQFLGRRLISWQCKKQAIMATSTTKAEYVAAASCKGEHNTDFHPMVDFLEASPLRIETTKEGTKILATVDGIVRTVFESSLRRNLKLRDEEGISSLPNAELFENLTLMGYSISPNQKNIATALVCLATNRTYNFSKMIFDGLVKNINNKGEGSGTPTEPHHTPSPKAQTPLHTTHPTSSLPPVSTTSIPTINPTETTPIRHYTRRTRIAQSSVLSTVADEPAYIQRDVSQGEACPTDSGFIADQDRATMAKSSTLPHDSAPRVTSPAADEGRVAATRSRDDAPIKGRSIDEGEAATERISDDTEEMAMVLTSMDATTVLAGGTDDVPTGSGSIPTVGLHAADIPTGSDVVPTASLVFATATVVTLYSRRKGKEVMVESNTLKKQRLQEQIDAQFDRELEEQQEREDKRMTEHIARDAEVARIHAEEELQSMIDGLDRNNETIAKYLQEYQQFAAELPLERRIELISDLVKYQENYVKIYKFQSQQRKRWTKKQKRDYYMAVIRNNLGWKVKDFKGMTFEEVEAKFNSVYKQMEDFIPVGSKEEAERYKRKGMRFDQESSKKLKSSKEVIKEAKSTVEILEEKIKEMMQLIPIEEVYVEALQVKHPIIDWKVYTEGQRSYWKINKLGGSSAFYQFFVNLLKYLDRDDLNQLWALVKEYLSIRPASSDKEMELWV